MGRDDGPGRQDGYVPLSVAAAFSGLSVKTLRRAISSGYLPAFRPSRASRGLILLLRRDLVAWIEGSTVEQKADVAVGSFKGARRDT